MKNEKRFFETMESDIMNADIPESEKNKLIKNFLQLSGGNYQGLRYFLISALTFSLATETDFWTAEAVQCSISAI